MINTINSYMKCMGSDNEVQKRKAFQFYLKDDEDRWFYKKESVTHRRYVWGRGKFIEEYAPGLFVYDSWCNEQLFRRCGGNCKCKR